MANPQAEISIRDLAQLVANLSSPPLPVTYIDNDLQKPGYMPSKVPRSLPSIVKLSALGWKPSIGIEEGFSRTVKSYSSLTD